jgi:hypothetical protein
MEAPAAPIKAADKNKILRLMNVKRTKTKASQLANAVQRYFNQFPSFTAALDAVIYDVGMQIPNRNRSDNEYKTNTELAEFYCSDEKNNLPSMGKTSARRITDWLTSKDSNMGDLKGALEALATTAPDAKVQRIAKKLASNVGNTQLVTKKNLKADDGSAVAGYFDPETNTIFLDAETGISTHPILHEVFHAVTSPQLRLTKRTRLPRSSQEYLRVFKSSWLGNTGLLR